MISGVESGAGWEHGAGHGAAPGAGGLVNRPGLFQRLSGPARVTMVSAPPGSGKTVLLRSWISRAGLGDHAGWVEAERDERDPQRFWLSVLGALRRTAAGSALVQTVTAAPELDGWTVVERLLKNLATLRDPIWLVVDDLHELGSDEILRQLELLVLRAPPELRFVLATRHDVRLGLHRLRLEGELAEIREPDLRFSLAEARELFDAAGVELPEPAVMMLHERTEGWAAGLRMAALSLAGHPDPVRFAEEFSGSERTVAEYLVAEVLGRQPEPVRRLLLRTSVLDRVNGELADLLTGDAGGERVLQDLEEANAFVVSLDPARSWFRYHQMFAGLLTLELRRTEPGAMTGLHRAAGSWFAAHGYPVEAIRHAQAAEDWDLAGGLLADHWPSLHLDGQDAVTHQLLSGFPPGVLAADAELAALIAADELAYGTLDEAERYLGLAERATAAVAEARRAQARLLLGIVRLLVARQRGNLPAEALQAQRLRAMAGGPEAAQAALGEELRALALISLGYAQGWTACARPDRAPGAGDRAGAPDRAARTWSSPAWPTNRRSRRPGCCRAPRSTPARRSSSPSGTAGATRPRPASPARHWAARWRGRGGWMTRRPGCSAPISRSSREPRTWRRWRSSTSAASSCWRAARPPTRWPPSARPSGWPGNWPRRTRSPGRCGRGSCTPWRAWARLRSPSSSWPDLASRNAGAGGSASPPAALRLAQDDPEAALSMLGPVLDGSVRLGWQTWLVEAFLLAAIAQEALGDPRSRRPGTGTGTGPRRGGRRAAVVPAAPGPEAACPSRSAPHRSRRPDRGDQRPAGGARSRFPTHRAAAAGRAAERQ